MLYTAFYMGIKMPVVEAVNIKKYFPVKEGFLSSFFKPVKWIKALDGVNIKIGEGEIHAVVGESGSGKTTLGRIMIGLIKPTEGKIYYRGKDIFSLPKNELKSLRREIQIIFQDPYSSLNPRFMVREIIEEPLKLNGIRYDEEDIENALNDVGLIPSKDFIDRYPHELSGGQRQRVAIARAIVIRPKFIVADEPVSMLDVSIKADFLRLMKKLNKEYNIAFLLITHDLSVATYISNRISVLYLGKIVESADSLEIVKNPLHPYTKALFQAIPKLGSMPKEPEIKGEISAPINIPSGCRFHPRCPYAFEKCSLDEPNLHPIREDHLVACHLYKK